MAAGFYIRIATLDVDGDVTLEPLRARGEVVASFNMDRLRRLTEAALARKGFTGVMCFANDKSGRRYDYVATGWPRKWPAGAKLVDARWRAGERVVAEIIL